MTESCPEISIGCNPPLPPYADESPFGIEIHKDCWKLLGRRVKDGGGYHNNNSHNSSFKGGYRRRDDMHRNERRGVLLIAHLKHNAIIITTQYSLFLLNWSSRRFCSCQRITIEYGRVLCRYCTWLCRRGHLGKSY